MHVTITLHPWHIHFLFHHVYAVVSWRLSSKIFLFLSFIPYIIFVWTNFFKQTNVVTANIDLNCFLNNDSNYYRTRTWEETHFSPYNNISIFTSCLSVAYRLDFLPCNHRYCVSSITRIREPIYSLPAPIFLFIDHAMHRILL